MARSEKRVGRPCKRLTHHVATDYVPPRSPLPGNFMEATLEDGSSSMAARCALRAVANALPDLTFRTGG